MRKSLLVSAALASGALLCSIGANAIPIKVGLLAASGAPTWTSPSIGGSPAPSLAMHPDAFGPDAVGPGHGNVSLSGWENDDGDWSSAYMLKNPDVPGLGVECNSPNDPGCTGYQIGSDPQQIIDLNISALRDWTGLIITLKSVEGINSGNLYTAMCAPNGGCKALFLTSCTTTEKGSCSLTLTSDALTGISDIWITPITITQVTSDPVVLGGSLYVCTPTSGPCVVPTAVPEPEALGMFGLGLLLIGTFFGLRRRRLDN